MPNNCLVYYACILSLFYSPLAQAQIIPDQTLPQNSEVNNQENIIQIDGGTEAGTNLFHSFEQFSLREGETALFNNSLTIENIFSRVTGQSISKIDGLIKANGDANLFLINSNGIIFGENASLDIGGSFIATTANSINFSDGIQFTTDANQSQPLLTITAPIGLGFIETTSEIVNRSQASPNGEVNTNNQPVGLKVQPRQTIALVGGNLNLDGGSLTASGGRIELGSTSNNSIVGIARTETGWELNYDKVNNFQNITLSNEAVVDSSGNRSGDIQIQANKLDLNNALVLANSYGGENGEDLVISASESITLTGDVASVEKQTFSSGDAGNLIIDTNKLIIQDGAYIDISIGDSDDKATGTPANLIIQASDSIDLIGTTSDGELQSGLFSLVYSNATHQGGSIAIETKNLTIQEGATIISQTLGDSSTGNISINASDTINILGISNLHNLPSSIYNTTSIQDNSGDIIPQIPFPIPPVANVNNEGNSGDITINTANLVLKDGAFISSSTFAGGDAGDITVTASESIDILGFARIPDGIIRSAIYADVNIDSDITNTTTITGNAGDLIIETKNLTIRNGGQVSTAARSEGEGGNLVINATESIFLSGTTPIEGLTTGQGRGGIFTSAQPESIRRAGNLTITTDSLIVENGAEITANTFGSGKGGDVTLNVERLIVRNGGRVVTGSLLKPEFGENNTDNIRGLGGSLTINAAESIEIIGIASIGDSVVNSSLFTRAEGTGDAGNLNIFTPRLTVDNEGIIDVSATGEGEAGSLIINAAEITLDNGKLTAETRSGSDANITITDADTLLLLNHSQITTNATKSATGGNIRIDSDAIIGGNNSDITANAVEGAGGNIEIETEGILGLQQRDQLTSNSDITATSETGIDGEININSPEVDPSSGLVVLPATLVDPTQLIAQTCPSNGEGENEFIVTGRGGLPPDPTEIIRSDTDALVDFGEPIVTQPNTDNETTEPQSIQYPSPAPNQIVEATGMIVTPEGKVFLTANAPKSNLLPQVKHCLE